MHLAVYTVALNLERMHIDSSYYRKKYGEQKLRNAVNSESPDPYNLAPFLDVPETANPTQIPEDLRRRLLEIMRPISDFLGESLALTEEDRRAPVVPRQKFEYGHSDHLHMVVQAYSYLEHRFPTFGTDLSRVTLYQSVQARVNALSFFEAYQDVQIAEREGITIADTQGNIRFFDPRTQGDYERLLDMNDFPNIRKRDFILREWREALAEHREELTTIPLDDEFIGTLDDSAKKKLESELTEMAEEPSKKGSPEKARDAIEAARASYLSQAARDGQRGGAEGPPKRKPAEKDMYGSSPGEYDLRPAVHRATQPLQLQPLYRRFHSSLKF